MSDDAHTTARSTRKAGLTLGVICEACQHDAAVDLAALIAAGRGDTPLPELRFRCELCGSQNCRVAVSGARFSRKW